MNQGIETADFKKAIITKTQAGRIPWKVKQETHQHEKEPQAGEAAATLAGTEETHLNIKAEAELQVSGEPGKAKVILALKCEELIMAGDRPTYRALTEEEKEMLSGAGMTPDTCGFEAVSEDGAFRHILNGQDAADIAAEVYTWSKTQAVRNADLFGQLTGRAGPHKEDYGTNPTDQQVVDALAGQVRDGGAKVAFLLGTDQFRRRFDVVKAVIPFRDSKFHLEYRKPTSPGFMQAESAYDLRSVLASILGGLGSMEAVQIASEDGTFTRRIKDATALETLRKALEEHKAKTAVARQAELESWLNQ